MLILSVLWGSAARIAMASTLGEPGPNDLEAKHRRGGNSAVIGIVEKLSGPSQVFRGGRSGGAGISIGLRVFEGDKLLSENGSRLHVRYKDGTYAEIGTSTDLIIERMRFKPRNPIPANKAANQFDESIFRFNHGVVRMIASEVHPLSLFIIKTIHAVIKVPEPSEFYLVQLSEDPKSRDAHRDDLALRVTRGKLEVMNTITNETMTVGEGQGVYVKVTGAVSRAQPFAVEQQALLKSRTRL